MVGNEIILELKQEDEGSIEGTLECDAWYGFWEESIKKGIGIGVIDSSLGHCITLRVKKEVGI